MGDQPTDLVGSVDGSVDTGPITSPIIVPTEFPTEVRTDPLADTTPIGVAPVTEPVPPKPGWRDRVRDNLAFVAVLAVAVSALVLLLQYHWRWGAGLLGGALLLSALFRALLPDRTAGLLAVRGRSVDVLTYVALGGAIILVALTIEGGLLSGG